MARPNPSFLADTGGMVRIGTMVINVKDARRASEFWSRALGYAYRHGGYNEQETPILDPPGGTAPGLALDESDRTHLDLYTDSAAEQRTEIERLVSLGATRLDLPGQRRIRRPRRPGRQPLLRREHRSRIAARAGATALALVRAVCPSSNSAVASPDGPFSPGMPVPGGSRRGGLPHNHGLLFTALWPRR
jgi:hypothetical protein